MKTLSVKYEVKCLLCGTEVGQVVNETFQKHAGCTRPLPRNGGTWRCCHCGGSLYLEPINVSRAPADRAEPSEIFRNRSA